MARAAAVGGAALGLLVAVLVIVNRGGGGLPVQPVTAKVLSATVKARTKAGATPTELHDGDTVRENAVLETDAAGLGEFRYGDGSIFRVGPGSNYSLTRARTKGTRRQIASRLVSGKSWHHVAHRSGSSDYAVAVLGASGKVAGTSFAVECPVETDCFYTVVKGRLKVQDAVDQVADLRQSDQVEVKFGRLDPVRHLSASELDSNSWIAQMISLDGDNLPPPTDDTTTTSEDTTTTTLPGDTTTTLAGTVTTGRTGNTSQPVTTRSGGGSPPPPPGTTTTAHPATTTTAPPGTTTTAPAGATSTTGRCDRRPKPRGCP